MNPKRLRHYIKMYLGLDAVEISQKISSANVFGCCPEESFVISIFG